MNLNCAKPFNLSPVKGMLDTRAGPDEIPLGGFRLVSNIEVDEDGGVRRMRGYQRLLAGDNNADLHDQLFDYIREPIHYLFSASSTTSFAKLFAATQNRIYSLNNATGNWKVISDLLGGEPQVGCPDRVWWAGQQGNVTIWTNNVDKVVYHILDQAVDDSDSQSVATIPDLDKLKVTKAGFVVVWNNIVILANLVQDGERRTYRAIWSDFKNPLSYVEKAGVSLAGQKDLDFGEIIYNAAEMGNALWVYTNRGIWEVTVGGTDSALVWRKRYTSDRGSNCLAYPRTLVSDGSNHYYWGLDGIYTYSPYVPAPERQATIHAASRKIFEDINPAACNAHHGAYFSTKKTIYWSWARAGDSCPSETLVYNVQYPFASYMGEGFTAFCNYGPDVNKILRDWLRENCICTSAELDLYGGGFVKEGAFCIPQTDPVCTTRPASFWSQTPYTVPGTTIVTEDYTQVTADDDSLCARLDNITIEDICGGEFTSDACNPLERFVMASSIDLCLKEWFNGYYREICTDRSACAAYEKRGYRSLIRSGAHHLNIPETEKVVVFLGLEIVPGAVAVPGVIRGRFGSAATAVDPNEDGDKCVIMWELLEDKTVECPGVQNAAAYLAEGTRPNEQFGWPLWHTGKFFYYEIEIANPNVNPIDTGVPVALDRISVWVGSNRRTS